MVPEIAPTEISATSGIAAAKENRPDARDIHSVNEWRRLGAGMLAAFVFGVAFFSMGRRSAEDLRLVFVDAPRSIVPAGHVAQVKIFRQAVPKGSTVFYIMDQPEGWQFGLWQRSLYPDYVLLPVTGTAELNADGFRKVRLDKGINFALSAGNPPLNPGFDSPVSLSAYPNGIPVVLGKLRP